MSLCFRLSKDGASYLWYAQANPLFIFTTARIARLMSTLCALFQQASSAQSPQKAPRTSPSSPPLESIRPMWRRMSFWRTVGEACRQRCIVPCASRSTKSWRWDFNGILKGHVRAMCMANWLGRATAGYHEALQLCEAHLLISLPL